MARRVGLFLVLAACGGGGGVPRDDGQTALPPDGDLDAAVDASPDAAVTTGSCDAITPWCEGGFCLEYPAAPRRRQGTPTPSAGWSARAVGVNEVWFSTNVDNTLAKVGVSAPLEIIRLPTGTAPGTLGGPVTGMTAVSATDIYACTGGISTVWHFDGATWTRLADGWIAGGGGCDSLHATSATEFWRTEIGQLSHKVNNTWTTLTPPDTVYAIDSRGPNDVWFGGRNGYLAHWNGAQYQVLIDASGDSDVPTISELSILGTDDVAFGAKRLTNGMVMTSAQLGYPGLPENTWGVSPDDFWIATRANGSQPRAFFHYQAGTWTQYPRPPAVDIENGTELVGTGADDVWFLSERAIAHWDGTTLEGCASWGPTQPGGRLKGLGTDYADLWLLPEGGKLSHSVAGADFTVVRTDATFGFDAHASDVFAVAGIDDPVMGGTRPVVGRYAGGTSWTSISCPWSQGEDALLLAAKIVGTNDAWFAGNGGHVYHWDGATCTLVPHPLAVTTFRRIDATGPNDVWIFGDSATLHWNGTSLARHAETIAATDSVGVGASLWVVGGTDVREWNGTTWSSKGAGSGIASGGRIWASSGTDVWVLDGTRELVRFDGTMWTPQEIPSGMSFGSGTGYGLWGNGTPGDFLMSRAGTVLRHR